MSLVGEFSQGSPVSPTPSFRCCYIFTSITLIDSQDLGVKSCPNLFTRLLTHSILPEECSTSLPGPVHLESWQKQYGNYIKACSAASSVSLQSVADEPRQDNVRSFVRHSHHNDQPSATLRRDLPWSVVSKYPSIRQRVIPGIYGNPTSGWPAEHGVQAMSSRGTLPNQPSTGHCMSILAASNPTMVRRNTSSNLRHSHGEGRGCGGYIFKCRCNAGRVLWYSSKLRGGGGTYPVIQQHQEDGRGGRTSSIGSRSRGGGKQHLQGVQRVGRWVGHNALLTMSIPIARHVTSVEGGEGTERVKNRTWVTLNMDHSGVDLRGVREQSVPSRIRRETVSRVIIVPIMYVLSPHQHALADNAENKSGSGKGSSEGPVAVKNLDYPATPEETSFERELFAKQESPNLEEQMGIIPLKDLPPIATSIFHLTRPLETHLAELRLGDDSRAEVAVRNLLEHQDPDPHREREYSLLCYTVIAVQIVYGTIATFSSQKRRQSVRHRFDEVVDEEMVKGIVGYLITTRITAGPPVGVQCRAVVMQHELAFLSQTTYVLLD
ncbi:hypothetical protein PR048_025569 [Dryococelus australis]|uniref:Uncharacterized protein n=1 Tax=Dryococelus australis TaxID=614101 RepID=A0ABQ9GRR2_9NEOP|nr:hypothetical protein PR048_025569 [Dryococelus australis]